MIRFLRVAFFVILLLCCHLCYAQDQVTPPENPPLATASEKTDIPNVSSEQVKLEDAQNENDVAPTVVETNKLQDQLETRDNKPSIESSSIDERMADFADEANDYSLAQTIIGGVGLFLLLATTLYARGAWLAAKDAVTVTREIGEKQSCAYVKINDVRVGHNQAYAFCEITIENVGSSPCVEGSITAKVKSENTLVPTFMETNEIRDFYSEDDTCKFGIIQTGHTHSASLMWFGGHPDKYDRWFDLFLSDIGAYRRIIFEVTWKDVFGKWHTSSFDAHKHNNKGINWDDLRIWHEDLKVNPKQKYNREN